MFYCLVDLVSRSWQLLITKYESICNTLLRLVGLPRSFTVKICIRRGSGYINRIDVHSTTVPKHPRGSHFEEIYITFFNHSIKTNDFLRKSRLTSDLEKSFLSIKK